MITLLLILFPVIIVNYTIHFARYIFGLNRLLRISTDSGDEILIKSATKDGINSQNESAYFVSVVVAARNEEYNIAKCLNSLLQQDYPKERYEIIIIDDHSTDNTAQIIRGYHSQNPQTVKLIELTDSQGKKSAINEGLKVASGSVIAHTDADCVVPVSWISSIMKTIERNDALFVTGSVMFYREKGLFNAFQCIEFNSLIASTAAAISIGKPIMCNGANMAYRANILVQEKGVCNDDYIKIRLASGDDVFKMLMVKKRFGPEHIAFIKEPAAVVYTNAMRTLKAFLDQRVRWISKRNAFKDKDVIYTALTMLTTNLLILITAAICLVSLLIDQRNQLTSIELFALLAGGFALKSILDYILLHKYTKVFGQQKLLRYLPLMEIFVMVYTVVVGLLSAVTGYDWKGRKLRR